MYAWIRVLLLQMECAGKLTRGFGRADQKTAEDYGLEGGVTLHLVLALRGGR
jgi:hypothetical protein